MLLLALTLAGASIAPHPAPVIQRAKRVRVARVPARARPNAIRIPIVATPRDPNQRYRLTGVTEARPDGKDLAVRDTGMACGVVGAPVCPSNGTPLVRSTLDEPR